MPKLVVKTGKTRGRSYDVAKSAIIGRGETAQVRISDTKASREHCRVFNQGGTWVVADLNSVNGILVNGVKTTRKNLRDGDEIEIGATILTWGADAGAPAKKPAKAAGGGASGGKAARSKAKEKAFADARAAAQPKRGGGTAAPSKTVKSGGEGGGVEVSDRVLQFSKIDSKKASPLDFDIGQYGGVARYLIIGGALIVMGVGAWGITLLF